VTVFLGVDGGGTKTALCLIDREGHMVAEAQAPSCYYFGEGVELVGRVLQQGVEEVCRQAGITPDDIDYAFFGLPSYGEVSGDIPALDAAPGRVLGHERYACDNDMVCGWAGSLGGADGINVISGTGSMTYGERAGQSVRVGGWGELFGDEGSAYWIAIRGLNAFSRMSDGRLPVGPLHGMLREHLGLASDLDLVDVVLNRWQGGRSEIAALSRTVTHAASAGDECAAQILTEAAKELANIVDTTRRRLAFAPSERVPVSYSGGTFNADAILDGFSTALEALYGGYELREPLYSPVIGAALYAAKLAQEPLEADALRRLHSTQEDEQQSRPRVGRSE
jgi:N-acetylglucosamine kinase-like BadF-type ATPase